MARARCRTCSADRARSVSYTHLDVYKRQFLVRGGEYKLARGDGRKHNVVIEFKDEETARACYASPEYQEAVKHLSLSLIHI